MSAETPRYERVRAAEVIGALCLATDLGTKDEVADYLESYASRFELPVRTGVRVDGLSRNGNRFVVTSATGGSGPRTWWWRWRATRSLGCLPSPPSSIRASSSCMPASTGILPGCRTEPSS